MVSPSWVHLHAEQAPHHPRGYQEQRCSSPWASPVPEWVVVVPQLWCTSWQSQPRRARAHRPGITLWLWPCVVMAKLVTHDYVLRHSLSHCAHKYIAAALSTLVPWHIRTQRGAGAHASMCMKTEHGLRAAGRVAFLGQVGGLLGLHGIDHHLPMLPKITSAICRQPQAAFQTCQVAMHFQQREKLWQWENLWQSSQIANISISSTDVSKSFKSVKEIEIFGI